MVGLDLGSALSRRMGGRKPLDRGRENEERTVRGKSLGRAQSQEGNIEMKRGTSVQTLELVVEGEAMVRRWRRISGEHKKLHFLLLKRVSTSKPHSNTAHAQRPQTLLNTRA